MAKIFEEGLKNLKYQNRIPAIKTKTPVSPKKNDLRDNFFSLIFFIPNKNQPPITPAPEASGTQTILWSQKTPFFQ